MANRGVQHGALSTTVGSAGYEHILNTIGLNVTGSTVHDFLVMCPYHGNSYTPSLSVSKSSGKFLCFNPSCGARGNILDLIMHVTGASEFSALRMLVGVSTDTDVCAQLDGILDGEPDFNEFSQDKINELHANLHGSRGHLYMASRGFTDETLDYFAVGYSKNNEMVTVPVYSHNDVPVGLIGRSVAGKSFKNSVGLPSSKVFFNLNSARRHSDTAIIVESAFDAMSVHQAGYPNVIAVIGGHMSNYKFELLNRNFMKVIIMTDNDKPQYRDVCASCGDVCNGHNPGRELGKKIARGFGREVYWAMYDDTTVYPDGAKDATDMTEQQIRSCIKNSINDVELSLSMV